MADDKFFQEEEQKAQEEIEKIKLGEVEYEPKELESYVEKGKRLDEFAKKYNTYPDKAWSAYGKTTQENKALKEQLEKSNRGYSSWL
jgi:DNA repair ATPase RecN